MKGFPPPNPMTTKEAVLFISHTKGINVSARYLQDLCLSGRLKSEIIGRMRFIDKKSLEEFNDYRKPGRPKRL